MSTARQSETAAAISQPAAIVGERVELQLLTTLKCNLKCTYCSLDVGEVRGSQTELKYDIEQLAAFVETQLAGKEIYVTFYGGEPTLNRTMMEAVMQRFPALRFQLQTNGTLLDDLPDWMLARLSNILISIDGGERTTDSYRGRGIWRKVQDNVQRVRHKVGGTVTARVTWGSPDTSFEELDDLAQSFDFLYWQFVADEMYFSDSLEKRKAVLLQLIDRFFAGEDALYPIVPLMGIVRNKLLPNRGRELYCGQTQCRVSTHLLNVMPSGQIFPCPDMMYVPQMQMGEVQGNWLQPSPLQPTAAMPCTTCEAFSWCRRNCLKNLYLGYVKNDQRYRRNVVEPICELLRFIGRAIDERDPQAWFSRLSVPARRVLSSAEVYDYVEIMP